MKRTIIKSLNGVFLLAILLSIGCKKAAPEQQEISGTFGSSKQVATTEDVFNFAKGADVGWLQQMEATNYIFNNDNGVATNCLQILKDKGINSIRFRVWVNPSADKVNGHCSKAEVVTMATRASLMGFRIMIDFHYSDTWADPGHQAKPAAWANDAFSQLLNDVYDHTYDVMNTLKANGVYPEWVQVGNEITGGMLWPEGSTSNFWQLTQLINKGYDAVKAVNVSSKVIIHLDQGNDNGRFRWFFDNLTANGGKYDAIGLSYYPSDYTTSINDLGINLNDMVSRYNKDVIVVEVGGVDNQPQNTYNMLIAVQEKVRAVPNNRGLGVLYWEPQGTRTWTGGYPLSCWGDDGKPTFAINAFLDNRNIISGATYQLICHTGNKALDNYGSITDGAVVKQYTPGYSQNQQWIVTSLNNGYHKIKCITSGKVLDNSGSSTNGTSVIQWTDNAESNWNQQWAISLLGNGYYKILCRASGNVLDNYGSTTDGIAVIQWSDNAAANWNQQWNFVKL